MIGAQRNTIENRRKSMNFYQASPMAESSRQSSASTLISEAVLRTYRLYFSRGGIIIHPHSGWYFIFGHSPNRYRLRTSALNIDLPVTHLLLATRKRVPRIKDAQLVRLFVLLQLVCDVLFNCSRVLPNRCNLTLWTLS